MSDTKNLVLKKFISELVEQISVATVNIDEIKYDEPIFGDQGKMNLDSLDALELIMLLEKSFDIKIKGKAATTVIFQNFDSLGDYILETASKEKIDEFLASN